MTDPTGRRRPNREEQALREVGTTAVRPWLARVLVLLFLATLGVVPVLETAGVAGSGGLELPADLHRRVARALSGDGAGEGAGIGSAGGWVDRLVAANRVLLEEIDRLEAAVEERSLLQATVVPHAQRLEVVLLRDGNRKALIGAGEWLFYRPDVEHLVGPGFLDPRALAARAEGAPSWRPPPTPDPRPAILDLARQLAGRGIALVVVPTPVKPALHPERFSPRFGGLRGAAAGAGDTRRAPLRNPSFHRFVHDLEAAGVAVFDPAPLLAAERERAGEPVYLATDTHWTPAALGAVADELASWITERVDPLGGPAEELGRRRTVTEGRGDLVRMLRLPREEEIYPPREVVLEQILASDGRLWRPPEAARVLLLGDSFSNVFASPELGWGAGAGLAEQLAFRLGRPVARIARNAGGAVDSREALAAALDRTPDLLSRTRVVIYQFATRELSVGDWRPVDLGPIGAGAVAAGEEPPVESPGREVAEPLPEAGETAGSAELGPSGDLGEGFVVWESNRTGDWRLWTRRLDGSGLRQLTGDEPGRQHCCAHVSPDGAMIAYLSLPAGRTDYPPPGTAGELRLIPAPTGPPADRGSDASGPRDPQPGGASTLVTLVSAAQGGARTYGRGNRAVVWRSSSELVYVDGEGRTRRLELGPERGGTRTTTLVEGGDPELGYLVDARLTHATSGEPTFSLYDRERRRVVERPVLGGCEPYFSHNGRWGVWMSGAGGPIERFDLAARSSEILVRKNDPILVGRGEKGYLYFPMISRDGRLLAFGASAGLHDHHRADYDIYVAPTDPETLELLAVPIRLTDHSATDRYPDVFLEPLALGRFRGEAPFTVRLDPPAELAGVGRLRWDLGDGMEEVVSAGETLVHTYRRPGSFRVHVRREGPGGPRDDGRGPVGQVLVRPARPPRVVGVALRGGGDRIVVRFDEPVSAAGARAEIVSEVGGGPEVTGLRAADDGEDAALVVELSGRLGRSAELLLTGVADRAERPNVLGPTRLSVEPPAWPARRGGLVFLWQTGGHPNLVEDPQLGAGRAYALEAEGRARLDHARRMVLGGGAYWAPEAAGRRLLEAARASNELSIEATIVPGPRPQGTPGELGEEARIITFSDGLRGRNVTLGQRGMELVLRLRTERTGPNAARPRATLFRVEPEVPVHVVVTYSPGKLTVYRDGEPVLESGLFQGGLDHWTPKGLRFGSEWGAPRDAPTDWSGTLEGIALYDRVLAADEVRENALRYRRLREERPRVPRLVVEGRVLRVSSPPTLEEISPYRRALATFDVEVEEVISGEGRVGERLRVSRWAILDGETLSRPTEGERLRLTLEPLEAQPQLEGVYVADELPATEGRRVYLIADPS